MDKRRNVAGHLAAFLTILIWGTTFISTKILLMDLTPLEILIYRFVIGYVALWLAYPRRVPSAGVQEELLFIGAGISGVSLYFLMENVALTYTLASNVGVLVSVAPFFTGILAHFFLPEEKLRPWFFAGFFLAMLGLVLIGFNGRFVLKLNPLGDILAVLAAGSWAFYSILMRTIRRRELHILGCTRKVFFYGLLFMMPALLFMDFQWDLNKLLQPRTFLNLLYLGLGASAACFALWNWALGILGAVRISVYIYIVPVVTIIASFLILHEQITLAALCGTGLTLAGLVISERK